MALTLILLPLILFLLHKTLTTPSIPSPGPGIQKTPPPPKIPLRPRPPHCMRAHNPGLAVRNIRFRHIGREENP
ncbi:hypothetical protein BDV06DRAFT_222411 [Aspergillus oleicola]